MKKKLLYASIGAILISCNTKSNQQASESADTQDTLTYAFKATYSSNLTAPSHPEIAQKVLTVWKMFETNQIDSMKPYFGDSITYDDATGNHYHGTIDGLLFLAKKEMENLDSLRFDISSWESVHVNDKNEDWVNIWARERQYPKKGMPDTAMMQENWKVKDGKVVFFNEYTAKLAR